MDNKRVLLVDDNPSIHEDYQKILSPDRPDSRTRSSRNFLFDQHDSASEEEVSFSLTSCFQSEEAVEAVRESLRMEMPFAMAFVDSRMPPGEDGPEAIEQIWKLDPDIQIVFCTAFSDYAFDDLREKFGITDSLIILKKPFEVIEVQQLAISQVRKWNMLAQIRESERRNLFLKQYLKNIVDFMPSILIGVNQQGRITHWNKQAEIETGVNAEKALQQLFCDVFPELSDVAPDVEKTIQTKTQRQISRLPCQFGNLTKYKNVVIYPHHLNGIPDSAIVIINDVTDLWVKELQLQQARKMETIGNLTSGLAHDFNNYLGAISGSVELIQMQVKNHTLTDEELSENLDCCMGAVDRSVGMIQKLMSLSRKETPQCASVDLKTLLTQGLRPIERTLPKEVSLELKLPEKAAHIFVDAKQIEQVMMNLCVNAAHSMTMMREEGEPRGGVVKVHLKAFTADSFFCDLHPNALPGDYWMVQVIDTGVGISKETQSEMFTPFFTTKEKGSGTGLGLSMVYNIIQVHRGFIDVYSQRGQGTVFNVFLPVSKVAEASSTPTAGSSFELTRGEGLILVVDDEESIRMIAGGMLQASGYDVLFADNGQAGLEAFKENRSEIKAVLMDLAMPVLSGDEAFLQMREVDSDVKVLLSSGCASDPRIEKLLTKGLKGFIPKPFSIADLSEKIKEVCEK